VCEDAFVLGHLGLNVPDLAAAKRYYDDLAPLIGFEPFLSSDTECAYQPANGKPGTYVFLYEALEASSYSRRQTGLQHLAFMVRTRSAVDRVHSHVLNLGGQVLHAPRTFPEYPPPYYATFWLDPFGFMLEAVCHYDRD
jgi:catechol 2,3-dioxygenase-like lactoylglutathione lyase family enzyme